MPRMIPSARPKPERSLRHAQDARPAHPTLSRVSRAVFCALPAFLAACGEEDGPTAADITEAYERAQAEERAYLLERYVTPDAVPGANWGFASVRYEIDLTECEKAQDDRGHLCVFDKRLFAMGGDVEMERFSPIRDVEARVFRVSDGWEVEEIYDDEEEEGADR